MTASTISHVPAIRTRRLNLRYGTFQALKNVDLDIRERVVTAVIGPSGCGKSTLLRCFNRLHELEPDVATTGTVTILGKNIFDADVSLGELRQRVGMVFQRPNPLPMSVRDNVLFGLRAHSDRRGRRALRLDDLVESALREVQLWDDLDGTLGRDAVTLTLEQQQKLCIARLLPLKPQIILMDEPCSALDAEGTAAVERLIAALQDRYTIVVVTHNLAQARRISRDAVFMMLGEVREQGPSEQLFTQPQQADTRAYIEGQFG
jgi:phosphate transport system ATP-binding protein